MLATLAHRLDGADLPPSVTTLFADQRAAAAVARTQSCGKPKWRGARWRASGSSSCC
jgi:hypothetical protein